MTLRKVLALAIAATFAAACNNADDPTAPGIDGIEQPAADLVLETGGPPFYAIPGNGGFIPHTTQWAAIPFQRQLACVPADANLLVLTGTAFGCSPTVVGHEHWDNHSSVDLAPRQTVFRGDAVPIIFASWADVQNAIADSELTLPELLALPSAVQGIATQYKEIDIYGVSGPLGPGRGMYKINARGALDDGTPFRLLVNEVLGQQQVVQIEFR
jgi:hypothetical protein